MPASDATTAIKDFDKNCANEIKSLPTPPELVIEVVTCVGIILGEPHKEWADCLKMFKDTPGLIKRLNDVDAVEMTEKKAKATTTRQTPPRSD